MGIYLYSEGSSSIDSTFINIQFELDDHELPTDMDSKISEPVFCTRMYQDPVAKNEMIDVEDVDLTSCRTYFTDSLPNLCTAFLLKPAWASSAKIDLLPHLYLCLLQLDWIENYKDLYSYISIYEDLCKVNFMQ